MKQPIEKQIQETIGVEPKERGINVVTYTPHPRQLEALKSPSRFKVMRCGRRSGKTYYAVNNLFISALLQENGTFWYVAPTYRQAKQIAWRMFLDLYRKNDKKLFLKQPNESQLQIILHNGTYIEIKGADNEDSLRGVGLNGVVLDEYAMMKPNVWEEIIQPTLADSKGWAIFISTPKGYNHFYELEQQALRKKKDWSVFHFTTYDNPYIADDEIDRARNEMNEDYFAQEYLADYRKFTGLVYKEFSRETHLIEPKQIPSHWPRWRSIDAGYTNPFCCLWITQDPVSQTFYIYDEHYVQGQTTRYHAEIINGKSLGQSFRSTFIDPAARQTMEDLGGYGIYCTQGINIVGLTRREQTMSGISKVAELLKVNPETRSPGLYIFNHCVNLIKEFETYRWEEKRLGHMKSEVPHKEDDHAMDALRYFVNTYNVIQMPIQKRKAKPYEPNNLITGY